jgi:hypothetical protein
VTFNENDIHKNYAHTGFPEEPDPLHITDTPDLEINYTKSDYLTTYKEAMKRPDAELWHKAAMEEMKYHDENQTWTLITCHKMQKQSKDDGSSLSKKTYKAIGKIRGKGVFTAIRNQL